jgi:hypothetical protein
MEKPGVAELRKQQFLAFAGAAASGFQPRLADLAGLTLRLADDKGPATLRYGLIEFVVGHES